MNHEGEERKDEIIRLQSQIMQDILKKQMKQISGDLWGQDTLEAMRDSVSGVDLTPRDEKGDPMSVPVFGASPEEGKDAPSAPLKPVQPQKPDNASPQPETKKAESGKNEEKQEEKPETIEELKAELNSYIGLDTIKEEVNSLINWVSVCKARTESGLPTPDLSLHMMFSGNPGTGKTMIARLMSRIYKALGVLSKGHLIEVDRSGLVAGYVGQTAIKTQEVINKALGGVLFIDEAYALTNRGENDYGQEAVDTLLKAMEDHRDDFIVIVAGYIDLMQEFIHSNPGLESRFNRFMNFPDYTVDEMMGIFDMRCGKSGYTVAEDARDTLKSILEEKSKDVSGFGNARGVRNLFESAIARQADRLAASSLPLTKENLMALTGEDLIAASKEKNADSLAPDEEEARQEAANALNDLAKSLSALSKDQDAKKTPAQDAPGKKTDQPKKPFSPKAVK